jgi:ubiquitin carboxyl-terminal hydrolase 4/11
VKAGSRVGYGKGRNRRTKTYSRKGNQVSRKLPDMNDSDQEAPDDGPLIRLGEGIVVDWKADAYNAMFEADSADDQMRGTATFSSIQTFHDAELQAKRSARAKRRKNGITLDDCLNEFGKEEVLSEADTWYCPRCKEHQRATKKFELWKTPDILIMHLKRFSSSSTRRDKLDVLVDFPIEGLDLTSRVVEKQDGKQEVYDLIAVDDHWGGLGGGHYTAFAKNFVDGEWYEYNGMSDTFSSGLK